MDVHDVGLFGEFPLGLRPPERRTECITLCGLMCQLQKWLVTSGEDLLVILPIVRIAVSVSSSTLYPIHVSQLPPFKQHA